MMPGPVVKSAFEAGTGNCIKFTDVTTLATPPKPHLVINLAPTGVAAPATCTSNVGYRPNGQQISLMNVFSGAATGNYAGACLDDQRDTMRLLMNAVGLRNEWRHKKRSTNMVFPPRVNDRMATSLRSLDLFSDDKTYADADVTDVGSDPSSMDLDSVTMITGERVAENPSQPVFTLTPSDSEVGSLNQLRLSDCETVQNTLYTGKCRTGFTACSDPYADTLPSFYPTSTINRALQCQNSGKMILTELLIVDLIYAPAIPVATRPAKAVIAGPSVPDLTVTFLSRRGTVIDTGSSVPPVPNAASPACAPAVDASCFYSVKFELTINNADNPDQLGGVINRRVYVNILPATGITVSKTIPVTPTLNCAPVFRTLAANVGPHPALTSERVYRCPDEIRRVPPPATSLQTHIVNAATSVILAARIVNYDIPDGVGQTTGDAPATQDDVVMKVFVSCNRASAGRLHIGGTSILGVVQAVDPEGDPVSYYAYSGVYRQFERAVAVADGANPALTYTGEMHSVSKGVISMSGIADLVANDASAGLVANSALVTPTVQRQVYIVAVDSHGAFSVLRARFFLACGEVVNA